MSSSMSNATQIRPCLPPPVFGSYMNFIGMQCNTTVPDPAFPNGPHGWFKEGVSPLYPRDLHQAMLDKRLNSNGTYP